MRPSSLAFFSLTVLLLAACSSSAGDTAPASDDSGSDVSNGDGTIDSPGSDTKPDTTPGGDSTSDLGGDTTPSDDTLPPPSDGRPDVVADSGGGPCGAGGTCGPLLQCCSASCVNEQNDPLNCGGCGVTCSGETSMCLGGHCVKPTCEPTCGAGQSCCQVDGPGPSGPPRCVDGPTCPVGCPACG